MPSSLAQAEPHPSSMLERPGLLLRLLDRLVFSRVSLDPRLADPLRRASEGATPVYLLRYRSLLDYLLLNLVCLRLGLPLAAYALGVTTRWLRPFGELLGLLFAGGSPRMPEPLQDREALKRALRRGQAVTLFLERRRSGRHPAHDFALDPLQDVVRVQREQGRPLRIVPILVLWQRKPIDLKPSLLDAFLGDREAPGPLGKLLMVLSSARRAQVKATEPLDVQEKLAADGEDVPDEVVARRLRSTARLALARERSVVLGPPLKDAAQVKAEILEDPALLVELKTLSEAHGRSEGRTLFEAARILEEIGAKFRHSMIQFLFWFLTPIWQRIYHGVEVDEEGLEKVRQAARNGPLVLVPSHKSHVDYLIISYIFHLNSLIPPHIAAGVNLSFWPLGAIFRRAGAFFLRRSFKGDPLYDVVFRAYVRKLIREGFTIEFFIEGGRSRTGKLLPPKLGLLSMIVDAALGDADRQRLDLTFVPISVGYERIIEGKSYSQELGGGRKRPEDLSGLLAARRVLNRRYGRLYISFGEPLPLSTALPAGADGSGVEGRSSPQRRELVKGLGERLVHGIERATIVNAVGVVSLALMSHPRRGMAREELLVKVGWLLALAREQGLPLSRIFLDPLAPLVRQAESEGRRPLGESAAALAEGATPRVAPVSHKWGLAAAEIVDEAVELLAREGLVGVHRFRDGEAVLTPVEARRLSLDYYKNMAVHLLVPDALVACAALALPGVFRRSDLVAEAIELRSLLRFEFIYPPKIPAAEWIAAQVDRLVALGLLAQSPGGGAEGEGEGETEAAGLLQVPRAARGALLFLRRVLQPFLDAYWAVACTLEALSAGQLPESELLQLVRLSWERLYLLGMAEHSEAGSQATFRNALALLLAEGYLQQAAGAESGKGGPLLVVPGDEEQQARRGALADRLRKWR